MHRTPRAALLVAALGAAVLLGACGDGDGSGEAERAVATTARTAASACPGSTTRVQDIPYASVTGVDPGLLSLDVYPPTHGCPAPVVVWVHGGGWRAGDKSNQMADKVRLWRDAGYTVVSVNYRLTDPASDTDRALPDARRRRRRGGGMGPRAHRRLRW